MIRNYIKISFRNLRKNKLYTALNISGLALGIATCLLIALYVWDELSFDRYNTHADRIYRINADIRFGGQENHFAIAPDPMAFTLKREYPQVEEACRFRQWGMITMKKGDLNIEEPDNTYVDSTLFKVFTLPMLEGDPNTALAAPNTMVITEKTARKYFGTASGIVGKAMRVNDNKDYRITGVMRDIPPQSHFHFNVFLSMATIAKEANAGIWPSHNFQSYILLRPDADPKSMDVAFTQLVEKYSAPQVKSMFNMDLLSITNLGGYIKYSLINVRDIHLHSDRTVEFEANGDILYVWIFSAVALFILLLACINFMNLSTARSAGRAREVGMRKVLGSARSALIGQFLAESALLTGISFVFAIGLVALALPYFNDFSGKEIQFFTENGLSLGQILLPLAILALFTAVLAGSYPAFFLSGFRPIEVLKGKVSIGVKSGRLRSSLVVFQFFTSIALIISVWIVQQQLNYVQTTKLGFEKSQFLLLRNTWWLQKRTESFREELLRIPGVENVTTSNFYPVPGSRSDNTFFPEGVTDPAQALSSQIWDIDYPYIRTMGMEILQGRDFDQNMKTDSSCILLNESAAKNLGWTEPVGKKIYTWLDNSGKNQVSYTVVGIVKDFHFEDMHQHIGPIIFRLGGWTGMMGIRLKEGNPQSSLSAISALFQQYLPGQPFKYSFLDEDYDRMYRAEMRTGKILGGFAGFAILIACLGLFGLAAFTTEQRTKEIGIRKVLGASVTSVIGLLSRDFLRLVLIALILAVPLAWWAMQQWLKDFVYRVDVQWWVFLAAGALAMLLAFLTVGAQGVKAALMNPVKSLRNE